jgi:hypothetical protein
MCTVILPPGVNPIAVNKMYQSLSIYWIADEQQGQIKNLPTNKADLLKRNIKKIRSVCPGM